MATFNINYGSAINPKPLLNCQEYYKLGKLPSNAVPALHPSISREHALILHTKTEVIALDSWGGAMINWEQKKHQ